MEQLMDLGWNCRMAKDEADFLISSVIIKEGN